MIHLPKGFKLRDGTRKVDSIPVADDSHYIQGAAANAETRNDTGRSKSVWRDQWSYV